MSGLYWLCLLFALALFIYLLATLMRPEKF